LRRSCGGRAPQQEECLFNGPSRSLAFTFGLSGLPPRRFPPGVVVPETGQIRGRFSPLSRTFFLGTFFPVAQLMIQPYFEQETSFLRRLRFPTPFVLCFFPCLLFSSARIEVSHEPPRGDFRTGLVFSFTAPFFVCRLSMRRGLVMSAARKGRLDRRPSFATRLGSSSLS